MSQNRKVEALDGLRVLAIAAVVVYHANQAWLPGGFLGVTVFFVLTGYLTTLSVARRLASKRGFHYFEYLKERVARLWPMMLAVVGATAILSLTLASALLGKFKSDTPFALLFAQNIHYIVAKVSYFAAAGLPSPLTHLWYLGVLMQFYIAWPIVLVATWRIGSSRRRLCVVVAALMLASSVAMAVLYDPSGDTARIYYGPDTRAAELLAGSLLALATKGQGLDRIAGVIPKRARRVLGRVMGKHSFYEAAGIAAVAGLVAMAARVNGFAPFAYRGGILVAALLSAMLVGVLCMHRPTFVGRVLGSRPMSLIGKRSYALYLWHYPLLLVMNPATRTTVMPWWGWVVELAIVACVSEVSYRVFEAAPKAKRLGEKNADGLQSPIQANPGSPRRYARLAACLVAVACVVAAYALPGIQDSNARPEGQVMTAEERKAAAEEAAQAKQEAKTRTFDFSGTAFASNQDFMNAVASINATNFSVDTETGATDANVTLVGDSVPEDAADEFYEIFPNGFMDAKIGRQLTAGPDAYQACVDGGHAGDVVVWSIADNGWITSDQAEQLIAAVDGTKKVYLVTCRCPDAWQDNNNEVLRNVAAAHDNVEVIDWHAESEGHDDWFWSDGQHVRPEGAKAYVMMLRRAITGR